MEKELKQLWQQAEKEIVQINSEKELQEIRIKYLGKKGPIKDILGKIGDLDAEARKHIGSLANDLRDRISALLEDTGSKLESQSRSARLSQGVPDASVSRLLPEMSFYHPLTLIRNRMVEIFKSMGYTVEDGPELEEEFYNFEALNIPEHHPARDDHDSFYIQKGRLLRTHTSPVQARVMKKCQPPLAIVVPGRCFRRDAMDATHSHTFHQVEGLVVDEKITFADLKGTLLRWAKMMFGEDTKIRLRPDFFPFTEPSAELAVTCWNCKGAGCSICKRTGWVELAGCGMVDPEVFKAVDYDPEKYSGFAFGFGLERIAMAFYGINDIRSFFENDLRLLEQFIK